MTPLAAFFIGLLIGAITIAALWSLWADRWAIKSAQAEDAAYDRGFYDAKVGNRPESKKLIINNTL